MRIRISRYALLASIVLFLSGCVQTEIIDRLTLVQAIGFDKGDDGKIIGTLNVPIYKKDAPPVNHTPSGEAELKKSILQVIHETQPNPLALGGV